MATPRGKVPKPPATGKAGRPKNPRDNRQKKGPEGDDPDAEEEDENQGSRNASQAYTKFVSFAAEADMLSMRGAYKKAIELYATAMALYTQLDPDQRDFMCKGVLVARSKCWIKLAFPDQALLDADRALALWGKQKAREEKKARQRANRGEKKLAEKKEDFYTGLLAKAEALYASTEFEGALVFFHRGNAIRPEVEDFRLGIQKCRQAILNAIGDSSRHHLNVNGEKAFNDELRYRQAQEENQDATLTSDPAQYNNGVALLGIAVPGKEEEEQAPAPAPPPPRVTAPVPPLNLQRDRFNRDVTSRVAGMDTLRFETPRGGQDRKAAAEMVSTLVEAVENSGEQDRRTDRQLLEELDEDKAYLEQLLTDRDFRKVLESDTDITKCVAEGLQFLSTRKEFWRNQKPLYARNAEIQRAASVRQQHRQRVRPPRKLRPLTSGSLTDRPQTRKPMSRGKAEPARPQTASSTKPKSREEYFEATRIAIETLENVNNALEYDTPELGLELAKNFLARIGTMELADKPRILGNLYCSMGNTYLALNKPTLAAIHHRRDLDIAETYKFADATLRAFGNLGRTYRRMGEHDKARQFFVRQSEAATDAETRGRALLDIGRCCYELREYDKAQSNGEEALALARSCTDTKCELRANLLLGQTLNKMREYSRALQYFEEHVAIARKTDSDVAESTHKEIAALKALLEEPRRPEPAPRQTLDATASRSPYERAPDDSARNADVSRDDDVDE